MVAPITQALNAAKFSQFTFGLGRDASRQSLAVMYHPTDDRRFKERQDFLNQETGLHISMQGALRDDDDQRDFHEVASRHYDNGWGCAREFGDNPTRLMLGIYYSETPDNLQRAFKRAWQTSTRFESIRWDLNSFSLGLSALDVSMTLFENIRMRWRAEPSHSQHIYFAIGDRKLHRDNIQALMNVFGRGKVEKPDPQLNLFGAG